MHLLGIDAILIVMNIDDGRVIADKTMGEESMSEEAKVTIKLDDRVRLLSAVLAATDFPAKAQKMKPHGTHAHARATRKYLKEHDHHTAVVATQALLDQNTGLEPFFALAMLMKWPEMTIAAMPPWAPPTYNQMLKDFYETAKLADWWKQEDDDWDKCKDEAEGIFNEAEFKTFLKPFLDDVTEDFTFMPNISYPTDYNVGFRIGNELVCIAPPPLAWGDSPPWPYDEPTMVTYTLRAAISTYGRVLLDNYFKTHADGVTEAMKNALPVGDQFKAQYPTWKDQFFALFLSAVVAMYLEKHVDEGEYKAYMLMQKKARGMAMLPGTVSVMRRYLQEVGKGGKYSNLIEFLPFFPRQLRVAKKIVTF